MPQAELLSVSEAQRSSVQYPGGLAARYRWAGQQLAEEVFGLSESGGALTDHGSLLSPQPDRLCRAQLRIEGPLGEWTARFASPSSTNPAASLWDTEGLLVVKYGFAAYALGAAAANCAGGT